MSLSTQNILLLTAGLVGFELLFFAYLLARQSLFHWLSAGFWAWVAFMIYFFVPPVAAVVSGNVYSFQTRLQLGGGVGRGLWVAFVILVGIGVFFLTYLRTRPHRIYLGVHSEIPIVTPFFLGWLALFSGFGLYSLLASRSGLTTWRGEEIIMGGRFVGDVTGYQNAGYMLLVYPIVLLLLWPHRLGRVVGFVLFVVFIILSLPHAWSRFATVSMLLALTMWRVAYHKRRWPGLLVMLGLVMVVLIYQARGHVQWQFAEIPQAAIDSLDTIGDRGVTTLAESDTQMLATFWLESAWYDNWAGYDYGLPFLNYMLTGWIPGRVLPQKYFLVDWITAQRPHYPILFDQLLLGAKSSLIGSFYGNGQLIAVVLEMALAGWLSRRLDGMMQPESPVAVRALGITWLSVLWMVWGSSDTWGLMLLGTMALPFIVGLPIFRLKGRAPRSAQFISMQKKSYVSHIRSH